MVRRNPSTARSWLFVAITLLIASCTLTPPPAVQAQTPPAATPCPSSSVLLTAKPIKGVGATTIRNACPAYLAALERWYASHPSASVADAVAAITGVPAIVPPIVNPPPQIPPAIPPGVSLGALYSDDFSSYTSTADFISRFWVGPARSWAASPSHPAITYDVAEKAVRYDWAARDPSASCTLEQTIGLMPRLYPPPAGTRNLWIRFVSKESPNFEHGKSGCGGKSYKFFLLAFEIGGSLKGRVGTYLGDASSASMIPTNLWLDMVGLVPGDSARGPTNAPLPGGNVSWGGSYHEWTLGLENIGSASASFSVYLDRVLVKTLRAPFLSGQTLGPGWAITFEMGANINNGPDRAQSRWFRELTVSTSKLAGVP